MATDDDSPIFDWPAAVDHLRADAAEMHQMVEWIAAAIQQHGSQPQEWPKPVADDLPAAAMSVAASARRVAVVIFAMQKSPYTRADRLAAQVAALRQARATADPVAACDAAIALLDVAVREMRG